MLGHRRGFIAGVASGAALATLVVAPLSLLTGSGGPKAAPQATAPRTPRLPPEPTAAPLATGTPRTSVPAEPTVTPESTPDIEQTVAQPTQTHAGPGLDPTVAETSRSLPGRTRSATAEEGPEGTATATRSPRQTVARTTRAVPEQVVPGKFSVHVVGNCESDTGIVVEWTASANAVEYVVTVAGPMSGGGRTTALRMELECPTQTGTVSIRIDALPPGGTPATSSSTTFYVQPPLDDPPPSSPPASVSPNGAGTRSDTTDRTPSGLTRSPSKSATP